MVKCELHSHRLRHFRFHDRYAVSVRRIHAIASTAKPSHGVDFPWAKLHRLF